MFGLSSEELAVLKKLDTPEKIQDFLDDMPSNLSRYSESCSSPRMALRKGRAHCIEGAFIAATALWLAGKRPILMDLKAIDPDFDHVVALFKRDGHWGAISKSNHPVLRYRDPIYRTLRELALSYFHEYVYVKTGDKTLRSYSRPFSLKRFGTEWITSEEHLWDIAEALDESPHYALLTKEQEKCLKKASDVERQAGRLQEWDRSDPRT
ncbi:MAG: hypothetical protein E6Q53_00895 [Candidatus Moraniibacteriota bacterium]|nr:MAG: hypothetical protein E6Q53_00895 [Candidatus Moranbacteria bacterium]